MGNQNGRIWRICVLCTSFVGRHVTRMEKPLILPPFGYFRLSFPFLSAAVLTSLNWKWHSSSPPPVWPAIPLFILAISALLAVLLVRLRDETALSPKARSRQYLDNLLNKTILQLCKKTLLFSAVASLYLGTAIEPVSSRPGTMVSLPASPPTRLRMCQRRSISYVW